MPFKKPAEPGFRFSKEKGVLRIFREDEVMVIRGWPDPNAVRKCEAWPQWGGFQPEFRLVKPYRPSRKRIVAERKRRTERNAGQLDLGFDVAPSYKPEAPAPREQRKRAFDQFRFSLPKPVARVLERFQSHQWPLLVMLHADPGALDLAESNPVLAYLIAHQMEADAELMRSLKVASLPQKDLLGFLKFPETGGMTKWFRKIEPESVNGENWRQLLEVLRAPSDTARKRLGHVSHLNAGVLAILANAEMLEIVSPAMLEEIAHCKTERFRAEAAEKLASVLELRRNMGAPKKLSTLPSIERLTKLAGETDEAWQRFEEARQERLEREREAERERVEQIRRCAGERDIELRRLDRDFAERDDEARRRLAEGPPPEPGGDRIERLREADRLMRERRSNFPPPPVPGIPGVIDPLLTQDALSAEGREMRNCVGGYGQRIRAGRTYVYRVHHPNRATLSIVRRANGWEIGELEVQDNRRGDPATRAFVSEWLTRYQISA